MRKLEEVENDLVLARKELAEAEGTKTEVYSRIVGYYRSVRNWNNGKLEEYGQRKLFRVDTDPSGEAQLSGETQPSRETQPFAAEPERVMPDNEVYGDIDNNARLLLFVRKSCPNCPGAKAAAAKLGIPVEEVDADTGEGYEEAMSFGVCATPTAILLDSKGVEEGRAYNAAGIASLSSLIVSGNSKDTIPQLHEEKVNAAAIYS